MIGEMSERFKETVLKTVVPATVPWVRIPLSPPNKTLGRPGVLRFLSSLNKQLYSTITLMTRSVTKSPTSYIRRDDRER